jgi:AcrR family transcriptional regulator
MPKDSKGRGDPARSLALLWRTSEPASRKAVADLSIDKIVATAVAVADADGIDALTMRAVSDRLGVGTMSVDTYVPGKGELLDLMVDAVYGEIATVEIPGADWAERLAGIARANWELLRRHPWMLRLGNSTRPVLGPNTMAKYENELRAIDGIPISDVRLDTVLTLAIGHAQNAARMAADAADTAKASGMTDDQWWSSYAGHLRRMVDPARYPTATRVGSAAGEEHNAAHDPTYLFGLGLRLLIDGVRAMSRAGPPGTARDAAPGGDVTGSRRRR